MNDRLQLLCQTTNLHLLSSKTRTFINLTWAVYPTYSPDVDDSSKADDEIWQLELASTANSN
jgi:hypothetical protein